MRAVNVPHEGAVGHGVLKGYVGKINKKSAILEPRTKISIKKEPAIYTETVLATKEFLDAELAKCKTWEAACADKSVTTKLVSNAKGFVKLKQQGAGCEIILEFLGKNWKRWIVQDALSTIKDAKAGSVDRKAVDSLPSAEQRHTGRAVFVVSFLGRWTWGYHVGKHNIQKR